jgi:hypothetical protein
MPGALVGYRAPLPRNNTVAPATRQTTANSAATSPKMVKARPRVSSRKTGTRASSVTPRLRWRGFAVTSRSKHTSEDAVRTGADATIAR